MYLDHLPDVISLIIHAHLPPLPLPTPPNNINPSLPLPAHAEDAHSLPCSNICQNQGRGVQEWHLSSSKTMTSFEVVSSKNQFVWSLAVLWAVGPSQQRGDTEDCGAIQDRYICTVTGTSIIQR